MTAISKPEGWKSGSKLAEQRSAFSCKAGRRHEVTGGNKEAASRKKDTKDKSLVQSFHGDRKFIRSYYLATNRRFLLAK